MYYIRIIHQKILVFVMSGFALLAIFNYSLCYFIPDYFRYDFNRNSIF
ncbi:hypothetical protein NC99_09930 [Sunxiuqinia dokdonensis]|uniref:Uncharacterized protein n=1 Tax=Sunxiuqinia dokdonensis TaxID=1409788 RepID=A0A0L8VCM5_9BACT|nr:hypothetical protein NC99_09930 [Sunxiuqinia dokdonensis]